MDKNPRRSGDEMKNASRSIIPPVQRSAMRDIAFPAPTCTPGCSPSSSPSSSPALQPCRWPVQAQDRRLRIGHYPFPALVLASSPHVALNTPTNVSHVKLGLSIGILRDCNVGQTRS